jgi:hypothetical protein
MRCLRIALLALLVTVVTSVPRSAQGQPTLTWDWVGIAEQLVTQLAPRPGERILLVARPGLFDELIPHLRYALAEAGAVDLGVIDVIQEPIPAEWDAETLRRAGDRARAVYREMLADVDGSIMLPGARPDHPVYAALQDLLREGRGRTIHFHWVENGSAFPLPGQPLPGRHEIDAVYQHALIETDYAALTAHQQRFVDAMRDTTVRVTTPLGTDIGEEEKNT